MIDANQLLRQNSSYGLHQLGGSNSASSMGQRTVEFHLPVPSWQECSIDEQYLSQFSKPTWSFLLSLSCQDFVLLPLLLLQLGFQLPFGRELQGLPLETPAGCQKIQFPFLACSQPAWNNRNKHLVKRWLLKYIHLWRRNILGKH